MPGFSDRSCYLFSLDQNPTAEPVQLLRVTFTEQDTEGVDRAVAAYEVGNLQPGEEVTHSFARAVDFAVGGFQVSMWGVTGSGAMVTSGVTLAFNGDCSAYPLISDGDALGFLKVVRSATTR